MEGTLFFNKSDRRYLYKELVTVGSVLDIQLIEPSSVINPTIILSSGSRVMEANYMFLKDFNRFYYVENYTFEYERIIVELRVDVLMSFAPEIIKEKVIIDRASNNYNFYLDDPEMRMNNYTSYEILPFEPVDSIRFDESAEQMVMVCSGNL